MQLTISSVLTTIVLCSILILVLCGLFKINLFAARIGPSCMLGLLLAVLIRVLIPFEFIYTNRIYIVDVLSPVRQFLIHTIVSNPIEIIMWDVLIAVWIIGFAVLLGREIFLYKKLRRCVALVNSETVKVLCERFEIEVEGIEEVPNIKIVHSNSVNSPYLIGWKKYYIILPQINYTKQQIKYVLQHELMHVRNKDIVWKMLVDVLCIAVWWNPVFWYLKRELFLMIELCNDAKLTALMSKEERIEYMECLKDMALLAAKTDIAFSVSFSKSNAKELKQRLILIANEKRQKRGLQMTAIAALAVSLFMTSTIVIESFKDIDTVEAGITLSGENTFLVVNEDKYDVYVHGEYLFTTDDLEPFQGLNVYVWHYKTIEGKKYRRLYDTTNEKWMADWILCE